MSKPKTLIDLLVGQHIGLNEVNTIARAMFNDATTMAGPDGYLVTGVNFDDLPEHVRGFIRKAILQFTVENILDADARIDDTDKPSGDTDAPSEPDEPRESTLSEAERYD